MNWYVEYEVEGHGQQRAGPYPIEEVGHHRSDIEGFEGVKNVRVVNERLLEEPSAATIAELFQRLGCPRPGTDIDSAVVFALLELEEKREFVKMVAQSRLSHSQSCTSPADNFKTCSCGLTQVALKVAELTQVGE